MEWISLTNILAFLAFCGILISFISPTKKGAANINKVKILLTAILGFAILSVTILKNNHDSNSSKLSQSKSDSIRFMITDLNKLSTLVNKKMDTIGSLTAYISKLDSLGIQRNPSTNTPIITKSFVNNIDKVETLIQQ